MNEINDEVGNGRHLEIVNSFGLRNRNEKEEIDGTSFYHVGYIHGNQKVTAPSAKFGTRLILF